MSKGFTIHGSTFLAAVALACSLQAARAGGPAADVAPASPSPAPSNGWAVPLSPNGQGPSIPQNGWSTPEPSTGSGAALPTSNSAARAAPGELGQSAVVAGTSQRERELGIVVAGAPVRGSRTVTNRAGSVGQLVPGVDTHATIEETSSGVEIVRGPASE